MRRAPCTKWDKEAKGARTTRREKHHLFIYLFMFCWGGGGDLKGNQAATDSQPNLPPQLWDRKMHSNIRSRALLVVGLRRIQLLRSALEIALQGRQLLRDPMPTSSSRGGERVSAETGAVDGGNPACTVETMGFTMVLLGILQGNPQKARVLTRCRISAIHSMGMIMFEVLNRDRIWWEDF